MEYQLVEAHRCDWLGKKIENLFKKGWILYGNPIVNESSRDSVDIVFYQAMIREEEQSQTQVPNRVRLTDVFE